MQPPDVPPWQATVSALVKLHNYLPVKATKKKKVTKCLWSTKLDSDLRQTNECNWKEVAGRIHSDSSLTG